MQPAFTDPKAVLSNFNTENRWRAVAGSLILAGFSVLLIVVNLWTALLGTGSDLWTWLTGQNNAEET